MNVDTGGVGEHLQREYCLRLLRIGLDASRGVAQAALSVSNGMGVEVALLTASMDELGLPDERETGAAGVWDLEEERFRLSDRLAGALKEAVSAAGPDDAPLWLSLVRPTGLLTTVPWERVLNPVLGVPILRLPCQLIAPRAPRHELSSVICFASPVASPDLHLRLIDQFIEQVPAGLAKLTRLHVFADASVHDRLLDIQREYSGEFKIEVYDPPDADRSHGRMPWLTWIRDALSGQTADVVHFLCHCYRVREQGALALSEAPGRGERSEAASLLFAPDLVEFLDGLGAWSVAFSSPPTNKSLAGMRMLQDQVSRLRPGPIFLHDMAHPQAKEALAATYGFLYGEGCGPPNSGAVSLVAHPFRSLGSHTDETSDRILNDYTLAGHLGDRLTSPDQPAWVATSQRILEASADEVALAVEGNAQSGRKRGRDLVLRALAEYAERGDVDPSGSSSPPDESAAETGASDMISWESAASDQTGSPSPEPDSFESDHAEASADPWPAARHDVDEGEPV